MRMLFVVATEPKNNDITTLDIDFWVTESIARREYLDKQTATGPKVYFFAVIVESVMEAHAAIKTEWMNWSHFAQMEQPIDLRAALV